MFLEDDKVTLLLFGFQSNEQSGVEGGDKEEQEKTPTMPRKAGNPIINKK